VACGIIEVDSLAASVDRDSILADRRGVIARPDRIAGDDGGVPVLIGLYPLLALVVVRIGLNLRATVVLLVGALQIEIQHCRIGQS